MLQQLSTSNEDFEVVSPAQDNTMLSEAVDTNFEMNKTIVDGNSKNQKEEAQAPESDGEAGEDISNSPERVMEAGVKRKGSVSKPIRSVSPTKK